LGALFNTLVFEHELREAAKRLAAIAQAGADSIIVQDVGIAQLARQIAPALEIHGSTQMSITSAEGVELARRFGVTRVVLARELTQQLQRLAPQGATEGSLFIPSSYLTVPLMQ
jgi:putative protease